MPSGNKPLPEPMMTKVHDTIWRRYKATMSEQTSHYHSDNIISHYFVIRLIATNQT